MAERLFLTSRLLSAEGVVHGFSLRAGGVSKGPFESLNLGRGVGDDPGAVEENLRRLAEAAGLSGPGAFASAHQVHGDRVLGAVRGKPLREIFAQSEPAVAPADEDGGARADAVVALEPGIAAAVRVADCVPVLLYAPDRRIAAAVHSGWRGARVSIAGRGVRALQHVSGADPAGLPAETHLASPSRARPPHSQDAGPRRLDSSFLGGAPRSYRWRTPPVPFFNGWEWSPECTIEKRRPAVLSVPRAPS